MVIDGGDRQDEHVGERQQRKQHRDLGRGERASAQAGQALAAQDACLGGARGQLVRQAGDKPAKDKAPNDKPPNDKPEGKP